MFIASLDDFARMSGTPWRPVAACGSRVGPLYVKFWSACKSHFGVMPRMKKSLSVCRGAINAVSILATQITIICHISAGTYPVVGGVPRPISTACGGRHQVGWRSPSQQGRLSATWWCGTTHFVYFVFRIFIFWFPSFK